MNPESVVQRQLDAYNDRDLDRFMACYSDEVQLFRPTGSSYGRPCQLLLHRTFL